MTQTRPTTTSESTNESTSDLARSDDPTRVFSTSILISAIRCMLSYVVFPWILPLVGASDAVGPWIGLPIGLIAIVFNVLSIRRFWRADHQWKWPISILNVAVIGLVAVLMFEDLRELFGR